MTILFARSLPIKALLAVAALGVLPGWVAEGAGFHFAPGTPLVLACTQAKAQHAVEHLGVRGDHLLSSSALTYYFFGVDTKGQANEYQVFKATCTASFYAVCDLGISGLTLCPTPK